MLTFHCLSAIIEVFSFLESLVLSTQIYDKLKTNTFIKYCNIVVSTTNYNELSRIKHF